MGYIGLYEATKLIVGTSNTSDEGHRFARKVMERLHEATEIWRKLIISDFALYGTPAESLTNRFSSIDRARLVRFRILQIKDTIPIVIM